MTNEQPRFTVVITDEGEPFAINDNAAGETLLMPFGPRESYLESLCELLNTAAEFHSDPENEITALFLDVKRGSLNDNQRELLRLIASDIGKMLVRACDDMRPDSVNLKTRFDVAYERWPENRPERLEIKIIADLEYDESEASDGRE